MAVKVALIPRLNDDVQAICRAQLPSGFELTVSDPGDGDDRFLTDVSRVSFIIGFPRNLSARFWPEAGHLKLVQSLSVGTDDVDLIAAKRAGVPVAVNGGANAISVAEHTVLLILALYRKLVATVNRVNNGVWGDSRLGTERYFEIFGKTVGLLGLGNIGRMVAERLAPFGPKLIYYDPFRLDRDRETQLNVEYVTFDEVLARADIVSLHLPLTEETHHLIGSRELGLMNDTAILINTARGPLVDEAALLTALESGAIAGAGLDVLSQEPAPTDHPLLGRDDVIVTPHIAGPTWDSWPRRFANGFANICRVQNGEAPLWTA